MWDQQKPKQPACDGNQFAEVPQPIDGDIPNWPGPNEYVDVKFDSDNNVIPSTRNHVLPENATAQQGAYGSRMFADNDPVKGLKGVNNYGPEDIPRATTIYVDNSHADRGKES